LTPTEKPNPLAHSFQDTAWERGAVDAGGITSFDKSLTSFHFHLEFNGLPGRIGRLFRGVIRRSIHLDYDLVNAGFEPGAAGSLASFDLLQEYGIEQVAFSRT
jgi:hypothetical protein